MPHKHEFSGRDKKGLYRAIYERRDVRREFLPDLISARTLLKILDAAHHAGSVGFMQPWNFIVIRATATRRKIKDVFDRENQRAASNYEGKRRQKYLSLKLEGILDAPISICVTCDPARNGPHVLGRNSIPETDLFSTCCAIQNLWLAARAEGIGMGWVSILNNQKLKGILGIPARIRPVAYLCLGYVTHFPEKPMLEKVKWEKRIPLEKLISYEKWGNHAAK